MPYVVLALLALGTGLGAWLGVADSPVMHPVVIYELVGPCATHTTPSEASAPCLEWDARASMASTVRPRP